MRQSWHSSPCPRRRGARSSITRGHSPDRCVCARESAGAGAIGEDLHRAGGPVGQRERPSSRKCEEARRSTDPPFAPPGVRITAPSNDEGSPIRQRLWSCPARMGRRGATTYRPPSHLPTSLCAASSGISTGHSWRRLIRRFPAMTSSTSCSSEQTPRHISAPTPTGEVRPPRLTTAARWGRSPRR